MRETFEKTLGKRKNPRSPAKYFLPLSSDRNLSHFDFSYFFVFFWKKIGILKSTEIKGIFIKNEKFRSKK